MLNTQKNKGFSLAEMMVVMLMLSIIFAAAAPILTKRATQTAEIKASGSGVPVGTIIIWASSTLPQGDEAGKWLECNGQSTASYPELKSVVGENVPDYQGMFLRGVGGNSLSLGVLQEDAGRNLTGYMGNSNDIFVTTYGGVFYSYKGGNGKSWSGTTGYSGPARIGLDASLQWGMDHIALEFRPINKSVKYLIKAKA